MHLDELLEEIGSSGPFQIFLIVMVFIPKLAIGYNMMIMAFGSLEPDWWCIDPSQVGTNFTRSNLTYKVCGGDVSSNFTCTRVYDGYTRTVVSEWDLVCEKRWITPIITSIQMCGVLLGAMIGGQSADSFGRKKTFYSTLFLLSALSISVGFVTTWQMFTVFRFLIGSAMGAYLVVCMFPVEFLGYRWRPLLTTVPFWATGICLLSLSSWLLHDWSSVHIAVGIFTVPFLLGWFVVPESIRWLAVKGKIKDAVKVVEMVAKMNKREKPENTVELIQRINEEENAKNNGGKRYSYLDIYRSLKMARHTIMLHISWWCISASYYGFAFGVGKFSGDYYLNQFLMNIMEFPVFIPVIFYMNKYGRRSIALLMLGLSTASCIVVVIVQYTVFDHPRGPVITALSLLIRLFVGQGWAGIITLTNESYPTVVRNLGYGAANMSARFGSIVAPFIFALSGDEQVPYIIVFVLLAVTAVITYYFLPETLGRAMEDLLPGQEQKKENEIEVEMDNEKTALNSV